MERNRNQVHNIEPNTDKPNTDKPNPDKPNTDEPNTDEPNTDEPNTDKPNTDEPNTDEPYTDKPNNTLGNVPHLFKPTIICQSKCARFIEVLLWFILKIFLLKDVYTMASIILRMMAI